MPILAALSELQMHAELADTVSASGPRGKPLSRAKREPFLKVF